MLENRDVNRPADRNGRSRAAIFDLDRTITRVGTFTPFLLSTRPDGPQRLALFARFVPHMALYKAGRLNRKTLKNRMLAMTLSGFEHARIAELSDRFVTGVMAGGLYADALAAIARHRADGDRLILATASVDFYARLIAERLGLDECIATATGFESDEAPPQIAGENCYGEAKREMVAARLDALYGQNRDNLHLSFYTDHISDLPLLQAVETPYVINPKPALHAHARQAGWQVCSWTALESQL